MISLNKVPQRPYFLSAFFVAVLMLAGCNKNNAQGSSESVSDKNNKLADTAPAVEYERTACYGTCPIYTARIMKDGTVHYQGVKFVEKTGDFTARISPEQVAEIISEANRLKFWEADSLYVTGATDFPSRILTLRDNGRVKKVRTESSEPLDVKNLMQFVEDTIMQALRENGEPAKK